MAEFTKLKNRKKLIKTTTKNLKSALQKITIICKAGPLKNNNNNLDNLYLLLIYNLGFDREVVYQLTAKTFLRL